MCFFPLHDLTVIDTVANSVAYRLSATVSGLVLCGVLLQHTAKQCNGGISLAAGQIVVVLCMAHVRHGSNLITHQSGKSV